MARMLITGGAGFIGTNFVLHRLRQHPDDHLVVLDLLTYAGNYHNLRPLVEQQRIRFVRGDIRDATLVERLLREESLDTIIHLAAETHVDRSIARPDAFITSNINGTWSVLEAARRAWLAGDGVEHRFHHVSSDEVFGSLAGLQDAPFTEGARYSPNSPYAASKAASDFLVRACHRTYGLQTTVSHACNNYGPFQFPEKLVPAMITNALRGHALPVYADGRQRRDWLHVDDHCAAISAIVARGRAGETYNVGAGSERANLDLVHALCELLDERFAEHPRLTREFPAAPPARHGARCSDLIAFVADRPGHDWRYAIDSGRLRRELQFAPSIDLASGLRSTVDWYLQNAAWWQSVLAGTHRIDLPPPVASAGA